MAFRSFEDLEVWQRGCRLAVDVFKTFTRCRNVTMRDQVQRSALSIPSNVAEGYESNSNKEFIRFLNIAKGSGGELRTQLYISRKLELLTKPEFDRLVTESKQISKMLHGLSKAVSKRLSKKPQSTGASES
ncbi:MAG TPA: four helix bundle protein [Candidatus Babeliales bacterium]|jgi:four helix bundle protein|nr:four helix bundle protein [Candidatus Babeliales bacterium]